MSKPAIWICDNKGTNLLSNYHAANKRLISWILIVYSGVCQWHSSSVRVHNFKHLLNSLANQSQILCGAFLGRGNKFVSGIWVTMPIYSKDPLKTFLFGTDGPITRKLGMLHQRLQPFVVCSNDDPGWTLQGQIL